jgi:protein-disulfide isomerase
MILPHVRRALLAPIVAWAMLASVAVRPAAAEFTPAQRAELVQILRDALKQDPSILRDAIEALQADEGRHQAEAARSALAAVRSQLVDPADPVAGNKQGDVTIVEFFDTRCPYCRRLEPAMADLLRQDSGVRLVFKDLPILGPASLLGAKALLAAQFQEGHPQGAYEKLRGQLMNPGPEPTREAILAIARQLGLDPEKLARDMETPAIQARIDANLALAHRLGIQGTPAIIIGDALIPGAVELAELRQSVATARATRR